MLSQKEPFSEPFTNFEIPEIDLIQQKCMICLTPTSWIFLCGQQFQDVQAHNRIFFFLDFIFNILRTVLIIYNVYFQQYFNIKYEYTDLYLFWQISTSVMKNTTICQTLEMNFGKKARNHLQPTKIINLWIEAYSSDHPDLLIIYLLVAKCS